MVAILIFFSLHWFLSLFFHSFFLHRYASHQMYSVNKTGEKIIYFLTWFVQGSSYLVPKAYGVMHRMHHTYSDTAEDPHSPHFFRDVWQMMWHTALIFRSFNTGKQSPETQFTRQYLPVWKNLDRFGHNIVTRLSFGVMYLSFYIIFASNAWWFLLLPIHFLMGPMQGAIVNWCGHKYGYSNFNNGDRSKNSSPWGLIMMGELFQNNHHHEKDNANFARRWFEFDMTYMIMRCLHHLKFIRLLPSNNILPGVDLIRRSNVRS